MRQPEHAGLVRGLQMLQPHRIALGQGGEPAIGGIEEHADAEADAGQRLGAHAERCSFGWHSLGLGRSAMHCKTQRTTALHVAH